MTTRLARRLVRGAAFAASAASALVLASRLNAQVPGELRGHVTDARTAQPVADASVDVVGRSERARSDVDGVFVLRGLEPRAYTVRVRAVGYASRAFDVDVANGRTTTLDIELTPAAQRLGAVVVSGEAAVRDTLAANATTYDRRAIEASHRRDVGELLQATPGVVVTQAGGPGSATHLSIRGSSANEVLVLLDGVPMNSSIDGEVDLSTIPLETVERVTVRSGAQSARYGGRALAGVVEIETRRPARDASVQARTGAWGERNASASVGESRALGGARVGGSLTSDYRTLRGDFPYEVPSVRGGGTARRINADVDSRALLATTSLDGATWSTMARGSWQDLSRGLAGSIVQPSATGRQTQSRGSAGLEGRGQHGAFSWTVAGDATREHVTFADTAPPFGTRYDDTVRATSLTSSASATLDVRRVALSMGGEARSLDVRSTLLTPGAPTWQRDLGAWATARGAHAFDRLGTRVDAEVGARVDESSFIDGATVSPRASLSVTRGVVVAAATLSSGYAAPSLADEFFHEGVLVRPNAALRPERARNDLDARLTLRDVQIGPVTAGGQAAVYRADVDDMILWSPDFRFIWSPSNFDVHRSGWEVSGHTGAANRLVDLRGAFNRADVAYTGPVLNGQVAYRPRTTGDVTAALAPGWLRVEVANQYVGERRTVPGSGLNTLEPYWRTDLHVTATLTRPRWTLDATVGVENLLDQTASMLVDYPFPSRDWTLALRLRRGGMARE